MVGLSKEQAGRQAAKLAGVRVELRAAFARALLAWAARPELARLGRPIVTEGYRSPAAQDALYEQGRTMPGEVVTYKRGGESKHNTVPAQALDVRVLWGDRARWCAAPPTGPTTVLAQVRAHAAPVPARVVDLGDGQVEVRLDQPVRGVAAGQAVVLYDGTRVLGSATLTRTSAG